MKSKAQNLREQAFRLVFCKALATGDKAELMAWCATFGARLDTGWALHAINTCPTIKAVSALRRDYDEQLVKLREMVVSKVPAPKEKGAIFVCEDSWIKFLWLAFNSLLYVWFCATVVIYQMHYHEDLLWRIVMLLWAAGFISAGVWLAIARR